MNNLSKVDIPKYNKLLPDFLYNRGQHPLISPNNKKMHKLLPTKIRKTFSNLQNNSRNFSDLQMKYVSLEEENISILSNLFSLLKDGWEGTIQSLPPDTQKQLNTDLRTLQELHNINHTKKMFEKTNKKVDNKSINSLVENIQEVLKVGQETLSSERDKNAILEDSIIQLNKELKDNKELKTNETRDNNKENTANKSKEKDIKEITEELISEQNKSKKITEELHYEQDTNKKLTKKVEYEQQNNNTLTKELNTEQSSNKELTKELTIEQQNTLKIDKIMMENKTLENNLESNSKEVKTLENEYKKTADTLVSLGILSAEDSREHPIVKTIVDKVMKEDREAIKKLKNELLAAGGLSPLLLLAGLLGKGLSDLKGLFKGAKLAGKVAAAAKVAKSLLGGSGGAAAKVAAGAAAILVPTEMGGKEEDDRVSKAGALTQEEASSMIKKQMNPVKKTDKTTGPTTTNTAATASTNAVVNTTEKNKEPLKIVAPKIPDGKNATPSVIDNSGQTNANNVTVNNINMNNKQEPSSSSTSFSEMLGLDSAKAKILQALK
jgi:hypothetical protein